MLSRATIPLLAVLAPLLLSTPTFAFPSQTHCLCSIADPSTTRFNAEALPPSEYSPVQQADSCSQLGPALQSLHSTNPDLYAEFLSHASRTTPRDGSTPAAQDRPLSTTLLLHIAAHRELSALGVVLPSAPPAPQSTSPPTIQCKTHIERFPTVHDSLITLCVLKIIVCLVILACAAECVTLLLRWYLPRMGVADVRPPLHGLVKTGQLAPAFDYVPVKSALRLSGEEKRLMAVPGDEGAECPFSPGSDKKMRAYRSGEWTPRSGSGRKEFEAYVVEEDDDELSRPVM